MTRGPELRGEMVRLRPVAERDADRMWEFAQDPESLRLAGMRAPVERQQVDEWARTVADAPGRYDWTITSSARRDGRLVSDELIGEIVLHRIDEQAHAANLRMALLPNYRGRGYGREAIFEVLRFAFDGAPDDEGPHLHRVGLRVPSINARARMLYESLGFREEGRLRDAFPDGDGWADAIVLGLLEDEFRASA
jgi:RimJ/RimL family protein N-acetyltransferase